MVFVAENESCWCSSCGAPVYPAGTFDNTTPAFPLRPHRCDYEYRVYRWISPNKAEAADAE